MISLARFSPQVFALIFLTMAIAQRNDLVTESYTRGYHARVRSVASQAIEVPRSWVSTDMPASEDVVRLLDPNVFIDRKYVDSTSGDVVELLIVQSGDIRALVGHYPPACYPNQGLNLVGSASKDLAVGKTNFTGTEYSFISARFGHYYSENVFNCFIMPNGEIIRDMDGYRAAAKSARLRPYGAAELQIVTFESAPGAERMVNLLLAAYQPVVDAIRSGVVGQPNSN